MENIYKNTPYLFRTQESDPEGENLARDILKKIGYATPQNVSILCSSSNYDAFKADSDVGPICFKYSMDASSSFFSREFDILQQLAPFCPTAYKHGTIHFGDKLQYLVCSYEFAENVKNHGIGSILDNAESFAYSFSQLSKVKIDRTFRGYLKDFFDRNQIANLPEHSRDSIKDFSNLERIEEILKCLKSEVDYLSQNNCLSHSDFCHGAMKPSNVLVRNGYFKFIDLHDGFMGNRFFDLTCFFMQIGLDLDAQKSFISQTFSEDLSVGQIQEYNACYNIAIRLVAYQAIFDFLMEVYLYESSRPHKLLGAIDLFSRNEKALRGVPSINQHMDFLFEDILEPIIGANKSS